MRRSYWRSFSRRSTRVTRSANSFQCKIVYGRCKFNQTHARRILLSFHQEVFSAVYPRGFPPARDFSPFSSHPPHHTFRTSYSGVTRNYVQISQLMSSARENGGGGGKSDKTHPLAVIFRRSPSRCSEYIECNLPRRARVKQIVAAMRLPAP